MQLSIDDPVVVNKDLVFKEIDGEAVLLDLERGMYFGLDPIGTLVWHTLVEHGRARPAIDLLLEEFDTTVETLEADVTDLLHELCASALISPQNVS